MFATAQVAATLPAADMERAKAWYSEKLGLQPTQEVMDQGAMYELEGSSFMIYPSEFAGTNTATAAGFVIDDFDAAVEYLRGRGVELLEFDFGEASTVDGVLAMPDGQKGAWFKDSEGNILAISNQRI